MHELLYYSYIMSSSPCESNSNSNHEVFNYISYRYMYIIQYLLPNIIIYIIHDDHHTHTLLVTCADNGTWVLKVHVDQLNNGAHDSYLQTEMVSAIFSKTNLLKQHLVVMEVSHF